MEIHVKRNVHSCRCCWCDVPAGYIVSVGKSKDEDPACLEHLLEHFIKPLSIYEPCGQIKLDIAARIMDGTI